MRIVIDLQGAQGSNRHRGIGRYSMSLAQAIIRNKGEHEIIIALNGRFQESIEPIRSAFYKLLPQENIRVWYAPGPVCHMEPANNWRRKTSELTREFFLKSLNPDVLYITSLFEGLSDDVVTSIGLLTQTIPTAVTLYDLIPLLNRKPYLDNPVVEAWYENKLDQIRRADLLLAISESSRQEGINYLCFPSAQVINVGTAADSHFHCIEISNSNERSLREFYGIFRPFLMYTGGVDHRKNIEGLIRAYAQLPKSLLEKHQLVIVCSIQQETRNQLEMLAKQYGLVSNDMILTGFVPDEDLIALYHLCKAFIFPSWHEGFGLPALEAMSCGTAVIAANTSSLPEVIGLEAALFDPFNDKAITEKIFKVLTDSAYRNELIHHGLEQAKKFSWDKCAKVSIAAFERIHDARLNLHHSTSLIHRRTKLAYISPLPSERSGISDYSAELLPELSRHYEIDVIVVQEHVTDPWIRQNCSVRNIDWFVSNAHLYDRVIYHFGNSDYHQHMFDLLSQVPGVVVLHDFFLSGIVAHMEVHGFKPNAWVRELYHAYGYIAVRERFHTKDTADVVWKYPCNKTVLENAKGVIVHSENSRRLAKQWFVNGFANDWFVIPHLRVPVVDEDKVKSRKALNLNENAFVVCSFGLMGFTKQNQRLLNSWLASTLSKDKHALLIFVGQNQESSYGTELKDTIFNSGLSDRIQITGWTDMVQFRHYLAAADMAVQLRTLSRGETSGTVLDCMNFGLPTIVNSNGSMADLPDDAVLKLPDEFEDADLIKALELLWRDEEKRSHMSKVARQVIVDQHSPRECADQYAKALESYYEKTHYCKDGLVKAIAKIDSALVSDHEWLSLAKEITLIQSQATEKQFFVDISELVQRDAKSGIQRVVRSVLFELLMNPPKGFRVEPVYADQIETGYRYARKFTLQFLNCPDQALTDEFIMVSNGDIFLGLDLQPHVVSKQADFYQHMRRIGVQVYFVVYDLLPILRPDVFPGGAIETHTAWLNIILQTDGAVCISRAVANELTEWVAEFGPHRLQPFKLGWFHLGADVAESVPTLGFPNDAENVLNKISSRPTFLMVGTIEPRKGYMQALIAFELLWNQHINANLVIVGKQGWMVEQLAIKLRNHPEMGKRLFWLEGISDEYLERIYATSSCLIVASEAEGFGLPLIEAAQHNLPIIARDIPVFREVATSHASYFSGLDGQSLVVVVKEWLHLYKNGNATLSNNMPWLTWKQCTQQLVDVSLNGEWSTELGVGDVQRCFGSD